MAYAQNNFPAQGYTVKQNRWDNAGENTSKAVVQFCNNNGIKIEPSPPYGPEGNGAAERIVQEHWNRARMLMFSSNLPQQLWVEALRHAKWLRNRLPFSRLGGDLPILLWDPRIDVNFTHIPPFGLWNTRLRELAGTVVVRHHQATGALGSRGDHCLIGTNKESGLSR